MSVRMAKLHRPYALFRYARFFALAFFLAFIRHMKGVATTPILKLFLRWH
jgi:hypothetical protein